MKYAAYLRLMRWHKPIGVWLLLWPAWSALCLANQGVPPLNLLICFSLGVGIMRSFGCVINDIADRGFDGKVPRTRNRELVTGRVSLREAQVLLGLLFVLALGCVLFLNTLSWQYAALALILAVIYPFCKRLTHLPQFVLGAAFAMSIPMAFAASLDRVPAWSWVFYVGSLCWTVAYDTEYAIVDREADLEIGIGSTAILFGVYDRAIIIGLLIAATVLWGIVGVYQQLAWPYWLGLTGVGISIAYQWQLIKEREPANCFRAFQHNQWLGLILFLGILGGYLGR